MLDRSFIEKIEELSKAEFVTDEDGLKRSTKQFYLLPDPQVKAITVSSLKGVKEFVLHSLGIANIKYPLIAEVSFNQVIVYSQLESDRSRQTLLYAKSESPNINFGQYLPVEDMLIKLQTAFVESENRKRLIELLSNLVAKDSVELIDDGMSQSVTVKKGVTTKENIQVQPIVKLTPHRTFREIEQVESLFLIRLNNRQEVAIFEADGGAWKELARERVVAYLGTIETSDLVILG